MATDWTAHLSSGNARFPLLVKRGIDVVMASALLVLCAPLILTVAMLVGLTMRRPVLFRQDRLGYRGGTFTMLKFRTMTNQRDKAGALLPDDRRLTGFGRFLRSTSLDELPELINVLKGEMSLVGPRPLVAEYRDNYTSRQWRRHEMPPGMAGPVLAKGRNALDWETKFESDIWYVDHWSLWLDVKILAATVWKVLKREGVSAPGHTTMPQFRRAEQGGSQGGEAP